ncbi:MAG: membrane protein insertase YidC [Desulfarculus sp.]|nr:membrane protein insertase YidC [Desulfarculus sp.]
MDSKRLFLALAISLGLMLLYTNFLAPKQPAPAPQPAAQAPAPAPVAPPAAVPGPPPAPAAPLAQQAAEVKVETPLYTAWFSQRGGTLRKMVLKNYTNQPQGQGGAFELLSLPAKDPYTLGLALPGLDPDLPQRLFTASAEQISLGADGQKASLSFSAQSAGLTVTKIYDFRAGSYAFNLRIILANQSGQTLEVSPELILSQERDLHQTNTYAFTGLLAWRDGRLVEEDHSALEKKPVESGAVDWMCLAVPYFFTAVAPEGDTSAKRSVRGWADAKDQTLMTATLVEAPIQIAPGQSRELSYLAYFGPRDLDLLEPLGHHLAKAVDFGWFDIIAKPMLAAMKFLHGMVPNYGVVIIIITILIKILFWPLSQKSYQSMKRMQDLQPMVMKLREKYADDKQRLNQETMQLYKTYKVNPMGGCLPMLLQIPVFIAFYKVLGSSIELRQAPFMLWINDLAAPDRLGIGFHIPYVGDGLPVLTLLMGASMFIQQKLTPTTGDPTQAKMMLLMPVIFTFMFINFPSGLVLYWLVNNVLSIGQQMLTNRARAKA